MVTPSPRFPAPLGEFYSGLLFDWDWNQGYNASFSPAFLGILNGTSIDATPLTSAPFTISSTVTALFPTPNGSFSESLFYDGTDGTFVLIYPGATDAPTLQYSSTWGVFTQTNYDDAGYTATQFIGWKDRANIYVAVNSGGDSFISVLDLLGAKITGEVVHAFVGASQWLMDVCGNFYALVGAVWTLVYSAANIPTPSIISAVNLALTNTDAALYQIATDYVAIYDAGVDNLHFTVYLSDGTNQVIPFYTTPAPGYDSGGIGGFQGGTFFPCPDGSLGTGLFSSDSTGTLPSLSQIVTYGFVTTGTSYGNASGPPPPDPPLIPPTPVPPYVPPDPGRVIPARNIRTFNTANMSHETTGNY